MAQSIRVNGLNLNYRELSSREAMEADPLILIHAFPYSAEMWNPQIEAFSRIRRTIAYDLRGLGRSGVGTGQYFIEDYVTDLVGMLDCLEISRATLCGLSIGGYIALRAVERHPERVSGLVLANTSCTADTNEGKIKRHRYARMIEERGMTEFSRDYLEGVFTPQSLSERRSMVDSVHRIVEANSPTGTIGGFLALAGRLDMTDSLSQIRVPTLIIAANGDQVTPVAGAEHMRDRIKGARLGVISDAGHLSNLENPDSFNQSVIDFLQSTSLS